MSAAFLVPRRAGDEWRDGLWEYARAWWADHGIEPIEGHHDKGPFNRGAAINRAAREAGKQDFYVIIDGDALPRRFEQVTAAIERAGATGRLTLAYDRYFALNRRGTTEVLNGYSGAWEKFVRLRMKGHVSSCIVVPAALWKRAGGFDERFKGWGFEDRAFWLACNVLAGGVERVPGGVFHLWHRRSPERDKTLPDYRANRDLALRYEDAETKAQMEALLDEQR